MNYRNSEKLISVRELVLVAFAVLLLAAANPTPKSIALEAAQQPVKAIIPPTDNPAVQVNSA